MDQFEQKIQRLDTSLFEHILSQSTEEDKQSLLALQAVVRASHPDYVYLEIGSYKGGSLQPYVADPQCARIISIDPRPLTLPDARGVEKYPENSTAQMLQLLAHVPGANIQKILSLEASTETLTPAAIPAAPDFCFIDGEHTNEAALRDARFCLSVVKPGGVIAFHDANLVYEALATWLKELAQSQRAFRPYILPDSVFVIELGAERFWEQEPVRTRLAQNYKAYLAGMLANDWYRYAYHMPTYRFLRRLRRFFFPCRDHGAG